MVLDSYFDVCLADYQTVPVVGICQLLAELGPFKIVLRFYIVDTNVPTILRMPFLTIVNPQIDW